MGKLAVLSHKTHHGILAQEWQQFLLRYPVHHELSNDVEAIVVGTNGDLGGLLDCPAEIITGEAQETLKHLETLDAAAVDYHAGLNNPVGPVPGCDLAQRTDGSAFERADLLRGNALRRGPEVSELLLEVHNDLLYPVVVDPRKVVVPRWLELARQIFPGHRVAGIVDLNIAVVLYDTTGLRI
jgi:hypothetical protein